MRNSLTLICKCHCICRDRIGTNLLITLPQHLQFGYCPHFCLTSCKREETEGKILAKLIDIFVPKVREGKTCEKSKHLKRALKGVKSAKSAFVCPLRPLFWCLIAIGDLKTGTSKDSSLFESFPQRACLPSDDISESNSGVTNDDLTRDPRQTTTLRQQEH